MTNLDEVLRVSLLERLDIVIWSENLGGSGGDERTEKESEAKVFVEITERAPELDSVRFGHRMV